LNAGLTIALVNYPDYNPDLDTPPLSEAELDELDHLLAALPGDAVMTAEGLDGYLTGLLLAPTPPAQRKSDEWLPAVWGGDGEGTRPFPSQKQRKRAAFLVLRHLHTVDLQLRGDLEAWEPLFSIAETPQRDFVDAEDWCIGFLQAVALDEAAWAPVFDDAELAALLAPLVLLGGDDSGLSDEQAAQLADPEQRDALSRAVVDAVIAVAAYRRQRASTSAAARAITP
jgi:uncharacterized protein